MVNLGLDLPPNLVLQISGLRAFKRLFSYFIAKVAEELHLLMLILHNFLL